MTTSATPIGAGPSLMHPRETPRPSQGWSLRLSGDLPPDLVERSRVRLRVVAFLYAAVYFFVGWGPALIWTRAEMFADPAHWVPGAISIPLGIVVGALTLWRRIPAARLATIGLLFEVVSSFGIAFAEYHGVQAGMMYESGERGAFGLSWVAPWVLLFTVVVPTPPRRAVLAAAASVSAVPIAYAIGAALGSNTVQMSAFEFFFALVFGYIFVLAMALTGAAVVYRLGTQVKQARELGSYGLVELLGRGGMGEVWSAQHRLLARPAAIKLIRPERLGEVAPGRREQAIARFEREAQATAAMRCPHTVELYDFGVTDEGAFYYVMELLDGLDAETLVQQHGPLPAERTIHILRQLCHSLGEAHGLGLIHRDVKPANVFVCCYGRELDWVKVLDFGLVKTGPEMSDIHLTGDAGVGGTPAFMAPEQVLGDHPVDGRTDLYATGCLAYWLLTGRLVFEGRNPIDTMMMHVQATPVPPSRRTEIAVPEALERIVLACIEKDPERRPASADVLANQLAAVPLATPWSAARALEWWRAHCPSRLRANPAVSRCLDARGVPTCTD